MSFAAVGSCSMYSHFEETLLPPKNKENKTLSDFCPKLFPESGRGSSPDVGGQSGCHQCHLGFVQYTSHSGFFGFLFIRLQSICLAFFLEVMKYLTSGEKYRQCNVKSFINLNLPNRLEGVCVFIQTLELHSFFVVFMCVKCTFFQICI